MKHKLNIFSNEVIKKFLSNTLLKYELIFKRLEDIHLDTNNIQANIIIINNNNDFKFFDYKKLSDNFLIMTSIKYNNLNINSNIKILNTPVSINGLRNRIENFVQHLKIQFYDISIENEKLTNLNNNSFCYLTKAEVEILTILIREKQTSKNFIKNNVLNIKSDIETNSLESHLTRIRKKINKVSALVKIQTKNEKLLITI